MVSTDPIFSEIFEALALALGIIEVALALDEPLRREDMLRLKEQILKVGVLVRKLRDQHESNS